MSEEMEGTTCSHGYTLCGACVECQNMKTLAAILAERPELGAWSLAAYLTTRGVRVRGGGGRDAPANKEANATDHPTWGESQGRDGYSACCNQERDYYKPDTCPRCARPWKSIADSERQVTAELLQATASDDSPTAALGRLFALIGKRFPEFSAWCDTPEFGADAAKVYAALGAARDRQP